MPMLTINTNVKEKDILKSEFLQEASTAFQAMIEKPMKFIAVHIHPEQIMSFGGSTEPCALITFSSVGKISRDENVKYSQKITELMGKLGVPSDRMYITFEALARENVGYNGTTFGAPKPE